ncbi:MAG: glycoside hydrolase family 127 protein [Fimbriimonadaceae bacterium]|nr:glycoside hydrolase family 127 protein [Fimbriimonadaceae bacterium]
MWRWLGAGLLAATCGGAQEAGMIRELRVLPAGPALYQGHRPPLRPSPLVKLPLGAVTAEGWVAEQLRLMAHGLTGHLPEIASFCRFEGNAWAAADGQGHSPWEELPYWLRGYLQLAHLTGDPRLLAEAERWIEAVLRSQEPDGWFGPRENKRLLDLWPNMVMLFALRSHWEATADARVLPLMLRYAQFLAAIPDEQFLAHPDSRRWWGWIRGADQLDWLHWLYNQTGEAWLLALAQRNHEHTAPWSSSVPSHHGVNAAEAFRGPAQWWAQSGDPAHLAATRQVYAQVWGEYGEVPGGLFGADENARPGYRGPRQGAETCTMTEFIYSAGLLLRLTGDPLWAARTEDVAFNSLPAAQTADLRALHYLTCPNQVQLDRGSKAPDIENGGDMFSYNPRAFRCCQHNVAFGWPTYTEQLWLATPGGGLAAALYAPSQVTARVGDGSTTVRLSEDTAYPFDDVVHLHLQTPRDVAFPLTLRIPAWCPNATVSVAGQDASPAAGSWVQIERTWSDGDEVHLKLPMPLRLRRWEGNRGTVSIDRGPLTWALAIPSETRRYGAAEDPWHGEELWPTGPWNYGLELTGADPVADLEFRRTGELPAQPWVPEVPLELRATGRRIANWQLQENGLVGEVEPGPFAAEGPREPLRLIPMGCARLRISAFPLVDPAATRVWPRPQPSPVRASHCWSGDTVSAVLDPGDPASSNDQTRRRFTWWDHRGGREWIELALEPARPVTGVRVYWFDDTGQGQCRVPAAWRLLWRDGETWQAVRPAGVYGVAPDQYNRVTCEAVTTSALRIEVDLREGCSGGMLSWRLEP